MESTALEDLTEEQRRLVERIEAGEDVPEGRPVKLRVADRLAKVVPIRMTDEQWRVLTREADELGLRPTTLLRMWLLERLRAAPRGHADGEAGGAEAQAGDRRPVRTGRGGA